MSPVFAPEWFDVTALPASQRADAFVRGFARLMAGVDVAPEAGSDCAARLLLCDLPGARLVSCFRPGARFKCHGQPDGEARTHDLALLRPVGGGMSIRQAGAEIRLEPGDATMLSLARPFAFDARALDRVDCLRMPATAMLSAGVEIDAVLLRTVPAGDHTLRLLTHYAGAVMQGMIPLATERHARLAANHICELAGVLFGPADGAGLPATTTGRLAAIKEQIARKLGSRDLSIEAIARANGITPRYVQMLFEAEGTTFTGFVLDQRLEQARLRLNRVASVGEPAAAISSIAFEAGFGDLSYFNRTFRRRFGVSPSQFRKQASEAG